MAKRIKYIIKQTLKFDEQTRRQSEYLLLLLNENVESSSQSSHFYKTQEGCHSMLNIFFFSFLPYDYNVFLFINENIKKY